MADKKVRVISEVDSTGAETGFRKIIGTAENMAEEVKRAGQNAGEGLDNGVGQGAENATKRVNKANSALNQSIRRQIGTLQRQLAEQASGSARGTRAYFEEYAKARGADINKLEGNLKELEAMERRVGLAVQSTTKDIRTSGFAVGNLAAQFQDIAVTAQMGMDPLMIALQQGTQISAALGQAGAAGAVRTLTTAFASIISPLSLVTIGITAAAAVAIQFASSLFSSKKEVKTLDERVSEFNGTLSDLDSNTIRGEKSLESLRKKYGQVTDEVIELINKTNEYNRFAITQQITGVIAGQLDEYAKSLSTWSSTVDFSKSAYDITNVRRLQDELKITTDQAVDLNKQFRAVGEAKGFSAQKTALKSLASLIDTLGVGAKNDFIRKLRSDLAQLQLDLIKTEKTVKDSIKPPKEISETEKKYKDLTDKIQESIKENNLLAGQLERTDRAIGDSAYQTSMFKREIELVTAAKKANITITDELAATFRKFAKDEAESAKRVKEAQERLDKPVKLSFFESANKGAEEWVKKYEDSSKTVRDSIVGAFDSATDAITEFVMKGEMDIKRFAQSVIAEFVKIAVRQSIIQPIVGSIFPAAGAAAGGTVASARGNAFFGGQVQAFANGGVFASPVTFPMSGGRTGLMAEAGPEAIMPLDRDASGRLGVRAQGGQGVNIDFQLINQSSQPLQKQSQQAFYDEDMKTWIIRTIVSDYTDGGQMRTLIGER